jgi:hypothetical protein
MSWATLWAIFFTSSSGHPGSGETAKVNSCCISDIFVGQESLSENQFCVAARSTVFFPAKA